FPCLRSSPCRPAPFSSHSSPGARARARTPTRDPRARLPARCGPRSRRHGRGGRRRGRWLRGERRPPALSLFELGDNRFAAVCGALGRLGRCIDTIGGSFGAIGGSLGPLGGTIRSMAVPLVLTARTIRSMAVPLTLALGRRTTAMSTRRSVVPGARRELAHLLVGERALEPHLGDAWLPEHPGPREAERLVRIEIVDRDLVIVPRRRIGQEVRFGKVRVAIARDVSLQRRVDRHLVAELALTELMGLVCRCR